MFHKNELRTDSQQYVAAAAIYCVRSRCARSYCIQNCFGRKAVVLCWRVKYKWNFSFQEVWTYFQHTTTALTKRKPPESLMMWLGQLLSIHIPTYRPHFLHSRPSTNNAISSVQYQVYNMQHTICCIIHPFAQYKNIAHNTHCNVYNAQVVMQIKCA